MESPKTRAQILLILVSFSGLASSRTERKEIQPELKNSTSGLPLILNVTRPQEANFTRLELIEKFTGKKSPFPSLDRNENTTYLTPHKQADELENAFKGITGSPLNPKKTVATVQKVDKNSLTVHVKAKPTSAFEEHDHAAKGGDEHILSPTTFIKEMMSAYDRTTRPFFDEGRTTTVDVNMFVSSMDSIDESKMEFRVSVYLRQSWIDDRLKYNKKIVESRNKSVIAIDPQQITKFWVPDLFLSNEKTAIFHTVTVPNRLMRISPDGRVLYSARISTTLSCHMDLKTFPLDTQICGMELESYGYTTEDLVFRWNGEEPIQVSSELKMAQFKLGAAKLYDCTKTYVTGQFTCIKVKFTFERDVMFYLTGTYMPSTLVIGLAWLSFFISIDAVPARITLGVLTILTVTTQITGIRSRLPPVSYIHALDVWTTTCLTFAFCGLLEYAVVNVISRRRSPSNANTKVHPMNDAKAKMQAEEEERKAKAKAYKQALMVDKIFRILFPCLFLVFNAVYWSYYAAIRKAK